MNQQKLIYDNSLQFDTAPSAHDSRTSIEAARKMTESGAHRSIKKKVLAVLKYRRVLRIDGATDEEIHFQLPGCRLASVVSARNSLVKQGLVVNSGRTRESKTTGMAATIWRIK